MSAIIKKLSPRMDMNMDMSTMATSSPSEATTFSDSSDYVQTTDPYSDQWKYARAFVYFFISWLSFFILAHIYRIIHDRWQLRNARLHGVDSASINKKPNLINRLTALFRSVTYRRYGRAVPGLGLPSLGVCLLVLTCAIFTITWTFTVRPYYRPHRADGSPPLALRSGLFAVGMTPFVYALAFKANVITYLTGVSHEKLNALHRWGARTMFFLSVVHTVPFLYQPRNEDGWAELKFWFHDDFMNANGCMALGALTWLVFASWAPLRRLFYEFFVYSHVIAAIAYLGFMFWHCEDLLTSWIYLWATAGIWIGSLILRFAQMNWYTTIPASFVALPDNAIKVSIPTALSWTPGQHAFIRFPRLAPFDNHPFSICSIPEPKTSNHTENTLEFVIRPYSGFTQRLMSFVKANPDAGTGVIVDGPYGGLPRVVESFNTVVLIAGGSGITAVVGFLLHLASKMKNGDASVCTQKIKVVWVVKNQEALGWFRQSIIDAIEELPEGVVEYRFHYTKELAQEIPVNANEKEAGVLSDKGGAGEIVGVTRGRPNCSALLEEWVLGMGPRACVIVSGPASLRNNVANSVAQLQSRVVGGDNVKEIYLHTEVFDW